MSITKHGLDLGSLVRKYFERKTEMEAAKEEMDSLKPSILEGFAARLRRGEGTKLKVDTPDWSGHCTYVPPGEVTTIDVDGLLERLTPDQRALVSVQTIDQSKLKNAVDLGLINEAVVQEFAETKERAGYIKFTGNAKPRTVEVEPDKPAARKVIRRTGPAQ